VCGIVVIGFQDSSQRWSGDVWPDTPSSVSFAESRCNLAQCMLDFIQFCTTPFGPVSITPPGAAEVAIAGTGVSLSSTVVYGPGQCAQSMLYVVWSTARSSPPRPCGYSMLDRSPQCPRSGESTSRILCRRSSVGSVSCIATYQFIFTASVVQHSCMLVNILSQSADG